MNIKKGLFLSAIMTAFILVGCGKGKEDTDIIKGGKVENTQEVRMLLPDFTELLARSGASVVNIQASKAVRQAPAKGAGTNFPEDDPFFEFWRELIPDSSKGNQNDQGVITEDLPISYGSGFIISEDGYILTNTHVVNDSSNIKITLNDKREFPAKLIGLDVSSDVALLKIDTTDLPVATLGSSSDLKVGEWVAAIGAPFGFDNTLTAGIVSAKGRSLPNDNYTPFIQTDVAINPGNSGGPLFNLKGQVVGINSRIYSGSGGFMGISFAIPIDIAVNVADQLRQTGRVARGQLGVQVQEVNYDLAKSFGMEKPKGALVVNVVPAGPADLGQIKSGDIIISVNGKSVDSSKDLPMMIGAIAPGQTIKLGVWRKNEEITTQVKLSEVPSLATAASTQKQDVQEPEGEMVAEYGLDLGGLTDNMKEETKLEYGVVVLNSAGKASEAGIHRGDVILTANYAKINSVESFINAMKGAKGSVPLMIRRGNDSLYVALSIN